MQPRILLAAAAAASLCMLAACGSGNPSGSSDPTAATGNSGSVQRAFSGDPPPGNLGMVSGAQAYVRTVDGREVLYVVPNPAPTTPGPLMIVLDYLGGNPVAMANLVQASQHAAAGEVLAFPAHQSGSWNNGLPGNTNTQLDITFLSDVIADATSNLPVDAGRIFMTGYSEGGFMANLYACTRPEMLAGFGMVAAAQLNTTTCETGVPLKMMVFRGTNDLEVPYNGFGQDDSAEATVAAWETIDACTGDEVATTLPVVVKDFTKVIQHQIPGCQAILYEIVNGAHTWPGSQVGLFTLADGRTSQNIDATKTQWDYLNSN